MIPTDDTTKRIQELNDQLRRTGKGGRVLFTRGVRDLGLLDQALAAVRTFDAFTPDNDPHEEHDFGSFTLDGRKLFWKIDLYDRSIDLDSEYPPGPEDLVRVLTIMLADEY